MRYTTINIQGNLISEEILRKIENAEANGQSAEHFGFERGSNLRSEIELAWSKVKLDWRHFRERMESLPSSDPYGTALSRRWMENFFDSLGYDLIKQRSSLQGSNNQSYTISHTAGNIDDVPVHIVGFTEPDREKNTLDIRTSGGTTRISPHGTLQEYLNVTDYLFGIVTNGVLLRLVRDSGRLIRLTYAEFDIKRMLDEDKYSEFTILYRLLHASRFPQKRDQADQSLLEKYYQESIESGNRIRNGLSNAVKESLKSLGNGLLNHPNNERLRTKILNQSLSAEEYNHQLLRLIYRLLFLMVTEERDLIFPEPLGLESQERQRKQKETYFNFYSIQRLRKLADKAFLLDSQYSDLWHGLMHTFRLFETGGNGGKMGIQAFGSDLFSEDAMPDVASSNLDNRTLLHCIRKLSEFEDEKKQRSRINYRGLDVEELGSVYEGLLELGPKFLHDHFNIKFDYDKSDERGRSGSHYTPEDLVKPLIQHSLEHLIEDRVAPFYKGKIPAQEAVDGLLSLKVCDVACGSGHILLSAARRIAQEIAKIRTGEQQPNPVAFRQALKETIRNCIYGVDKNPLAVELCKVALWLESHNPGEPLGFLDHHIKCGDAIVGLAHQEELTYGIPDGAFKTLPGDDKIVAKTLRERNSKERKTKNQSVFGFDEAMEKEITSIIDKYQLFKNLPERTPEEVASKASAHANFEQDPHRERLKQLADGIVAQFFIIKNEANKQYILTDAEYRTYFRKVNNHLGTLQSQKLSFAEIVANNNRFFHWFLEFPEVFKEHGFNCILGNPPYLGGTKISTFNGDNYFNYCISNYVRAAGRCDLIGYFVRRIFTLQKENGFHSIITTNTIAEGDTREGSLDFLLENNGKIIYAEKGVKWPGKANVVVTLYSLVKGAWNKEILLSKKMVTHISSYLTEGSFVTTPFNLKQNEKKAFMGSSITGDGFIIDMSIYSKLVNQDSLYKNVIFKYINGSDFNNFPNHFGNKLIINFFNSELTFLQSNYPLALKIVEESVRPERMLKSIEVSNAPWWKYWRIREELYSAISKNSRVLVLTRATSTHGLSFLENINYVYSDAVIVFRDDSYSNFCILQSSIHEDWSWRFSSRLKNDRRYSVTDAYETYPFPKYLETYSLNKLNEIGKLYFEHRKSLMANLQLGLTKIYNFFHNYAISPINNDEKDKQVKSLQKHIIRNSETISFSDAIEGILKLRKLHVEMDNAVLEAYGWQDISLQHDFYEVDYLPENDRIRYTIHPDARKEVLKRLLELNHKIHEEEIRTGLWDKKKVPAKKKVDSDKKRVSKGQGDLFGLDQL